MKLTREGKKRGKKRRKKKKRKEHTPYAINGEQTAKKNERMRWMFKLKTDLQCTEKGTHSPWLPFVLAWADAGKLTGWRQQVSNFS